VLCKRAISLPSEGVAFRIADCGLQIADSHIRNRKSENRANGDEPAYKTNQKASFRSQSVHPCHKPLLQRLENNDRRQKRQDAHRHQPAPIRPPASYETDDSFRQNL